jgi:hypothetical protein
MVAWEAPSVEGVKLVFRGIAHGTDPFVRQVFKWYAGRNIIKRIALGRIVNVCTVNADVAHVKSLP